MGVICKDVRVRALTYYDLKWRVLKNKVPSSKMNYSIEMVRVKEKEIKGGRV